MAIESIEFRQKESEYYYTGRLFFSLFCFCILTLGPVFLIAIDTDTTDFPLELRLVLGPLWVVFLACVTPNIAQYIFVNVINGYNENVFVLRTGTNEGVIAN